MAGNDRWTWAGEHVPGLRGQGFYLAASSDREHVENALLAAGYAVRTASGGSAARSAMARLSSAVGQAEVTNLDAFADVLADLTPATAGSDRLALLWLDAGELVRADLADFLALTEILRDASTDAWDPANDDDPANVVFETVALIDGFGVEPLG